ncbi:DUF5618 family protein [Arcicella sp. LKC2W]|uniref:DUF5618 family protein n=1 Tax=Arcicella sp. LKC2W TaxID=2984198 RepID=UPI002B2013F6|nr:DUF5618 family protein [Arcicella sp. LKC2W]MEA5459856.1 DUF5618 family protein [Arcicella sp. LKC2W]
MFSNAQKILIKAKKILAENTRREGNYYTDKRYVRMAGRTAWQGVIVGLNECLKIQEKSELKVYQKVLLQNPYFLERFNNAYDTLCNTLGSDGNLNVVIVDEGMRQAKELINWSDKLSRGYDIKDNIFEVPEKMSAVIEEQYNDPILYEEGFFESWEDEVRLQQKVDIMIKQLQEENVKGS